MYTTKEHCSSVDAWKAVFIYKSCPYSRLVLFMKTGLML